MKKKDVCLLALLPVVAFVGTVLIAPPYLGALLLFFGLPSLWLTYRSRSRAQSIALFSLLCTLSLEPTFDSLAMWNDAWRIPQSLFAVRLFHLIPVENVILAFLYVYWLTMLYATFFDAAKENSLTFHWKQFITILVLILGTYTPLFLLYPTILLIPYAYVFIGLLVTTGVPLLFLLLKPAFFRPFLSTALYVLYPLVLFEIVGLRYQYWSFEHGQYVFWIHLPYMSMPLEELLFWMGTCTFFVLSIFEMARKRAL